MISKVKFRWSYTYSKWLLNPLNQWLVNPHLPQVAW
jgi:hypothetical protein